MCSNLETSGWCFRAQRTEVRLKGIFMWKNEITAMGKKNIEMVVLLKLEIKEDESGIFTQILMHSIFLSFFF